MTKLVYYLFLFTFIAAATLGLPLFVAEDSELNQLNPELDNLKSEQNSRYLDLNSTEVQNALDQGTILFKEIYVDTANVVAVVVCIAAISLVFWFKKSSQYDPLYILAIFTLLVFIGAIQSLFFVIILFICIVSYMMLRRKQRA